MDRGDKICVVISIIFLFLVATTARALGPTVYCRVKIDYQRLSDSIDEAESKVEDKFKDLLQRINESKIVSFFVFLKLYQKYKELKEKRIIFPLLKMKDNLDNEKAQSLLEKYWPIILAMK